MVWQRFAKSPRIACAGSSPAASAKVLVVSPSDSTGGCQRSSLTAGNPGTCSSAESERDSAKVEVARSNRARSTNSLPISSCRYAIGAPPKMRVRVE